MKLKWLGHACFLITAANGTSILTDPFNEKVGYDLPAVKCDIVTVSHGHFDHNYTECVPGEFVEVNEPGEYNIDGIAINGISVYHDEKEGALRGNNIVFNMKIDGLNICHLGDLGHILDESDASKIGSVDILFIPIGGNYTIDADRAGKVINALNPTIILPMHYKTESTEMPIETKDKFLSLISEFKTENAGNEIEITNLGEKRCIVMKYK